MRIIESEVSFIEIKAPELTEVIKNINMVNANLSNNFNLNLSKINKYLGRNMT